MSRVYLDHNATTPLRREARAAMVAAMTLPGNPSSVHSEGRAAKAVVEHARGQIADLVGCLPSQVIFTSGATEAAALAVAQKDRHGGVFAALPTEHDCLQVWSEAELPALYDREGAFSPNALSGLLDWIIKRGGDARRKDRTDVALIAMSAANSETGIVAPGGIIPGSGVADALHGGSIPYAVVCDITQVAGKAPLVFESGKKPAYVLLSAHKMGGPKGVGALINFTTEDPRALLRGGGQEMGRRSGTENVIGIAGFGAAAEAAKRDVAAGKWERVSELRKILENALAAKAKTTIFVGKDKLRLPNTSCFITPGWKGEAQVIQMDLAGYAISAGSACSSGKVRASTVLQAMGFDADEASCAIRVSMGLETTEDQVMRFAEAWLSKEEKFRARAA